MSVRPFEEFVVAHFIKLAETEIKAGYKYQFKSPDSDNSKNLFEAFKNSNLGLGFIDVNNTKLAYINCHGVKLIPVIHKDDGDAGYTENFISFLRDEVSSQKGDFENTALLIIHNSMLDTLINSSNDITVKGGIFDPEKIKGSLEDYIDNEDTLEGREVSKILLEYQYELIVEDHGSMFGFKALHDAIANGDGGIRFHKIGLLNDPAILKMQGQGDQIRKRLRQNKELYDRIDSVVQHYPDQLVEHLPDLSETFIHKNFDIENDPDSWKKISFDEFIKEQDNNRKQELSLVNESSVSAKLIVRSKSEAKSAQKERHLLLEVDANRSDYDLSLDFTGAKISKDEIKVYDKSNNSSFNLTGGSKNSNLTLTGIIADEPVFFMISLKRPKSSENFKFKCLAVKKGWFNIDSIVNFFVINPQKRTVTLQTQDIELDVGLGDDSTARTEVDEVGRNFNVFEHGWLDFEGLANEVERITFSVSNGAAKLSFDIEGAAATDNLTLPLIFELDRGPKLFSDSFFGTFNRSKQRVYVENKELKSSKLLLEFLNRESEWINNGFLYSNEDQSITIEQIQPIAPDLASAYQRFYQYFDDNNTLPSLSGWGGEYQELIESVVTEFYSYLENIQINQYLDDSQKLIMKLGFFENKDSCWITPIHPLVLSYYLELSRKAGDDQSKSFLELPRVTLTRLNPQGLLPYLYDDKHDFSYVQAVEENCFWLHCVPQQKSDYSYITKLVREKIHEFSDAFSCLFIESVGEERSTLIINSINNYDNRRLFLGLVEHLIRPKSRSVNIHVNLYDDEFEQTEFDRFSEMASYETIKQTYGLNQGKAKDYADTIVDLMRTRITYSKFVHKAVEKQSYAHLSFFRNNEKVEVVDVNPEERLSGISAHGLINGEASASDKGNYITGFGMANLDRENNFALDFSLLYGRLVKPARKAAFAYRDNSAIALAVNDRFKSQLEHSYDSSIWTSIIDPKVTLDFFENSSDVLLIHYSDQYTSSAGYDAITVTRQTELYDKVLEKDGGGLVHEFNAFNGEWLLKLITDNDNIRKERKGILAAYKLVSILLAKSDITWVPMSVAEMVRVSGNIGLNMSESEFSRRLQGFKSGPISDDVLFVGFKGEQLYLLPLEVKTGKAYNADKAVKQAQELARYLSDLLIGPGLSASLYRSLLVRQALMQVDKYQLYKVYANDYFGNLLDRKEWWLKGDYSIAQIIDYPKGFVVANLENDTCYATSSELVGSILKLEIPASFIKTTISTPLQELWQDYTQTAAASLSDEYFLDQSADTEDLNIASGVDIEDVEAGEVDANAVEKNKIAEPFISSSPSSEEEHIKILIGHEVNHNQPVYWEPTNTAKFMNTNSGIIGTMGTGKTQCTKSVVTQLYRNQGLNIDAKPIGMLIFDYKSDYVDKKFIDATSAKTYKLHKLPYNPLSLFGDTPMLPVHTARGFSETMGKAFGLGQKQQLRLRKLIADAYKLAGISKSDSSTWSKSAPTIADVWALFIDQEKVEEDSLYAALESLYELEIFEDNVTKCTSLYELIDGITVIELASYPPQIQNLVVALTLDLFYSQMQKQGKPEVRGDFRQVTKLILVDEADTFMSQDFPSLRKVLKEGREYGVGVILSTQDITHFKTKENDYSAYILSWVIHRVSQIKNQDIKSLFNKDDKSEQEYLMKTIRELDKHYSLYVDGDKKISKIKDKAFWELG